MLSSYGLLAIVSVVLASCGAGLTAYNLIGVGPRTTAFWALAGPSLLAFGLGLAIVALSLMPEA
ncbi:MAG: hypothetical protein JSR55_05325 [Proteobacteria bacterium]|nr:hypothetical protein [Pseudomonadota bacterium]